MLFQSEEELNTGAIHSHDDSASSSPSTSTMLTTTPTPTTTENVGRPQIKRPSSLNVSKPTGKQTDEEGKTTDSKK